MIRILSGLVLASALTATAFASVPENVSVRVVKYADLVDLVKKNKGKVIVIDLWAEWCAPCMKAFPHLVELHHKYADQGLVAISVCLRTDEPTDKEAVMKFLKAKKAEFTNVILDEPTELWQEKFHIQGIPAVFVFNREGKWSQFKYESAYPEVEKLVAKLMGPKS